MNDKITQDSKSLVDEIFSLTGQKVQIDDPIVVAALLHSQLIRRAGQDAVGGIQAVMSRSLGELAEAVKVQRETADVGKMASSNKAATDVEALRDWTVKVALGCTGLVLLGAVVGAGIVIAIGR
jgi:hypothetical protein